MNTHLINSLQNFWNKSYTNSPSFINKFSNSLPRVSSSTTVNFVLPQNACFLGILGGWDSIEDGFHTTWHPSYVASLVKPFSYHPFPLHPEILKVEKDLHPYDLPGVASSLLRIRIVSYEDLRLRLLFSKFYSTKLPHASYNIKTRRRKGFHGRGD